MVEIKQEENNCFSQSVKRPRTGGNKKSSMKRSNERNHKEEEEKEDDGCILVRIDPKVLDCSICSNPLQPPISQCIGGHVACSPCRMKNEKCGTCSYGLYQPYLKAFEAVLQAMKVNCSYSSFGCKETIPYVQKHIHEDTCPHAPCSCPVTNCMFRCSTELLPAHLESEHSSYVWTSFCYNRSFKIFLKQEEPFRILHGKDGSLFLLLNGRDVPSGNSLSMLYINADPMDRDLYFELTVSDASKNTLHLKATPLITREWNGAHPIKNFLFVPTDFTPDIKQGYSQAFAVEVRIKKG